MSLRPAKAGIEVFVQQIDAAQRGGQVKAGAHRAAGRLKHGGYVKQRVHAKPLCACKPAYA